MRRMFGLLSIVAIAILSLTACLNFGPSLKKAEKLLDNKEYDKAIEVFEELVDTNEENYDAWFGIIEAQIDDEEYDDAEDTLEDLFEIIEDNYDEDSEDIDYEDVLDDFVDYAEDVMEEEGPLGSWYNALQPPAIDVYQFDYSTFTLGETIELDIPKGVTVYYNLDGDRVSEKDKKYKDGIELKKEGEYELMVAAINEFGIKGPESYSYFTVVDGPEKPQPSFTGGMYDQSIYLEFTNKEIVNYDIEVYYTLDGSDPILYGMYYYPEDGIYLGGGYYTLRAVAYDYYTDTYSQEFSADYDITASGPNQPVPSISGGTYDEPILLEFINEEIMNYDVDVYYTTDGSDPSIYGYPYYPEDGIYLSGGSYTIRAIPYDYYTGIYGTEFAADYTINSIFAPTASYPEGVYYETIILDFFNFNYDYQDVFYTLDGSDPTIWGSTYDPYYGVELDYGYYEVRAVIYDYNTGTYSNEFYGYYDVY